MSASDPFYAVRDALESVVHSLQTDFNVWKDQLQSVNTASDTKFRLKHEGELRGCVDILFSRGVTWGGTVDIEVSSSTFFCPSVCVFMRWITTDHPFPPNLPLPTQR